MLAIIKVTSTYNKDVRYKLQSINGISPDEMGWFVSAVNLVDYLIDLEAEDSYTDYKMLGYHVEGAGFVVWFSLCDGEIRTKGEAQAAAVAAIIENDGGLVEATKYLEALTQITNKNSSNDAAVIPINENVLFSQLIEEL